MDISFQFFKIGLFQTFWWQYLDQSFLLDFNSSDKCFPVLSCPISFINFHFKLVITVLSGFLPLLFIWIEIIDGKIFMIFFTKSVKTGNGNFRVLWHSSPTNLDTDPFSISKWLSGLEFFERYLCNCRKMARKGCK